MMPNSSPNESISHFVVLGSKVSQKKKNIDGHAYAVISWEELLLLFIHLFTKNDDSDACLSTVWKNVLPTIALSIPALVIQVSHWVGGFNSNP